MSKREVKITNFISVHAIYVVFIFSKLNIIFRDKVNYHYISFIFLKKYF